MLPQEAPPEAMQEMDLPQRREDGIQAGSGSRGRIPTVANWKKGNRDNRVPRTQWGVPMLQCLGCKEPPGLVPCGVRGWSSERRSCRGTLGPRHGGLECQLAVWTSPWGWGGTRKRERWARAHTSHTHSAAAGLPGAPGHL